MTEQAMTERINAKFKSMRAKNALLKKALLRAAIKQISELGKAKP